MSKVYEAKPKSGRTSPGARRSAARLTALQALYQLAMTGATPHSVLVEFLQHRLEEEIDGVRLAPADRDWFANLVNGVAAETSDLDDMLAAVLADDWPVERLELLLLVLLRQGAYELGYLPDVPARVVIDEYVSLAYAFFSGKEPGLVNGVLDRLAHSLRPDELAGLASPRPAGAAS